LCANKQGLIRTAIVTTHHNQTAAATNSQKQKFAATTWRETFCATNSLFCHNCYKLPPNSSTKFRKSTFYSLQIIIIICFFYF
jgi:hypothetical protein